MRASKGTFRCRGHLRALNGPIGSATRPAFPASLPFRLSPSGTNKRSFSLFSSPSAGFSATPSQSRIARLESDANSHPHDVQRQVTLFRELVAGGGEKAVVQRWERAENFDPSSPLLASDEAFDLYLISLSRSGGARQLASAVRRRDSLLNMSGATPIPASNSASPSRLLSDYSQSGAASARASSSSGASFAPSASGSRATWDPLDAGEDVGNRARPVHVVLEESRSFTAMRVAKSLGVTALYAFCILTFLSLALENSGLLKAGAQPVEFEPEDAKRVKFSDVHGVDEAKAELEEIVEFLKNPEKFSTLGGKLPKGVLLTGPPGTGKTMLARAVAGEAGVPFLFASGSSFDEMFVGVGAKRVRELFAAARKKSPAIVFIDELDAIGSKRSAKDQHYMKQTLNQLLVELDGFVQMEGVIIIAATNFPETLDKALTRPGRFDRHVVVGLPDVRGRVEILKHHMAEVQFDVDVDASVIARGTPGMSGADLQNLVNQAAVKASRESSTHVKLSHFEWAKDRILMGAERKSHFVTPESKRMTAYHEAGHALTALKTDGAMPLHKVTIMPRGQALGITFQLPEADKDSYSRKELKASIDVALGGRAAEEMIYGLEDTTTGCSSDLERATRVAGNMVRNYGFSDKIGLVAHTDDDIPYLSGARKDEIESEVRRFVDEGWQRSKKLLKEHEQDLHTLAHALVEYETLSFDEVKKVLRGEKLHRAVDATATALSLGQEAWKEPLYGGSGLPEPMR